MKRLIYILTLGIFATVFLVLVTSCSQYTCPTYSEKPEYRYDMANALTSPMKKHNTNLKR